MRSPLLRLVAAGASACVVALPAAAQAPRPGAFIARDTVVPVVIENDLSVRDAREGDRFTAHVDNDRDLPFHTRLIGRVYRMRGTPRGVVADMEFTDLILPDGSRHRITALPCSLDDKYVRHLDDGRVVVRENSGAGDVFGGAVGGFIIGSFVRRPILGSFVGALIGSIAAHNDRTNSHLLTKGEKIGALFERDTPLDSYSDAPPRPGGGFDRVYGLGAPPRPRDDFDGPVRPGDRLGPIAPPDGPREGDRLGPIAPPRPRGDNDDVRPVPAPAGPGLSFTVTYDGKTLQFDAGAQPYRDGGAMMVPLARTATLLGLTVERGRDNVIYIEGEESSVRLEQDSAEARLNGHKVTLPAPVVDRNGVLYAPIEILASMKKGNTLVNGQRVRPASD